MEYPPIEKVHKFINERENEFLPQLLELRQKYPSLRDDTLLILMLLDVKQELEYIITGERK